MRLLRTSIFSIVIFIFALLSVPSAAIAQSVQAPAGAPSGPPLTINVLSTTFDNQTRDVTFDLEIKNNTADFVDNLEYRIEFYAGEKLNTTGLIFGSVDFMLAATGELDRLSPLKTHRQQVVYKAPITLPGGNYFFRAFAYNEENSYYGAGYTKEPTRLTGRGGFLSRIDAALITPTDGLPHGLMEGPILEKNSTPLVAILKSRNVDFFIAFEEKAQPVFVSYTVTHINNPEVVVHSTQPVPITDLYRADEQAIEIAFAPWAGQLAGSHTATVSFTNDRGEKITDDLDVRLLYEGLLGRIFAADTGINSYRRGEPIDLNVNVVAAGDVNAKTLTLEATLKTTAGDAYTFTKEVPMNGTLDGIDTMVSFSDEVAEKKMVVEEMHLVLKSASGEMLDEHTVTLDPTELFSYPKESVTLRIVIISLLSLLVVLVVLGLLHKRTRGAALAVLIAVTITAGALVHSNPGLVFADAGLKPGQLPGVYTGGCTPDTWDRNENGDSNECLPQPQLYGELLGIWETPSNSPSGYQGVCENQCEPVEFWVKMQCKDCGNNGLNLAISYSNNYGRATSTRDQVFNVNTTAGYSDYGYYVVQGATPDTSTFADNGIMDGALAEAPVGDMVGVPITSNDVINWWIYGPFGVDFCFEDQVMCESPRANAQGIVTQQYNIRAETQFGAGYCELSYSAEDEEAVANWSGYNPSLGVGRLNDTLSMSCQMPACVEGTFYMDENQDGLKQLNENYLKSAAAPEACTAIATGVFGALTRSGESYTQLASDYCYANNSQPYFLKELLTPNAFTVGIDTLHSPGWIQTGIQQLVSTTWAPTTNPLTIGANKRVKTLIGISTDTPVVLSCSLVGGNTGGGGGPGQPCPCQDGLVCSTNNICIEGGGGGGGIGEACPCGSGLMCSNNVCVINNDTCQGPQCDDTCPGGSNCDDDNPPQCNTAPSLEIFNIATDLEACYPHENIMCGGLQNPKPYNMMGYSLRLSDPCHPKELWFVDSHFKGELVQRDTRRHGDSWDVAINQQDELSEGETHGLASDGWTVKQSINNGQAREVDAGDVVSLTLCNCVAGCMDSTATNYDPQATQDNSSSCEYAPICMDSSANNYEQPGECTYNPPPQLCNDPQALNYGAEGACQYPEEVCDDTSATNYGAEGSCNYDYGI